MVASQASCERRPIRLVMTGTGYTMAATTMSAMRPPAPLPTRIAGIDVPQDAISGGDVALGASIPAAVPAQPLGAGVLLGRRHRGTGRVVARSADPLDCIADARRRSDPHTAEHDLLRGGRCRDRPPVPVPATRCPPTTTDRVAVAIVLHMRPSVTLEDGVEAVLLDRATSLDVRGEGYDLVGGSARPSSATSRAARSTATSWRPSRTRSRSGRPARATAC